LDVLLFEGAAIVDPAHGIEQMKPGETAHLLCVCHRHAEHENEASPPGPIHGDASGSNDLPTTGHCGGAQSAQRSDRIGQFGSNSIIPSTTRRVEAPQPTCALTRGVGPDAEFLLCLLIPLLDFDRRSMMELLAGSESYLVREQIAFFNAGH